MSDIDCASQQRMVLSEVLAMRLLTPPLMLADLMIATISRSRPCGRGEAFRGPLLPRGDIQSELGEAGAHRRIAEHLHHCAIQLGDDVLGRALRGEKSEPARGMEARHPGLIGGRNIGHGLRAARREVCNRFDGSGLQVRQRHGGLRDHQVDLTGEQIDGCGPGTAVGNELKRVRVEPFYRLLSARPVKRLA